MSCVNGCNENGIGGFVPEGCGWPPGPPYGHPNAGVLGAG